MLHGNILPKPLDYVARSSVHADPWRTSAAGINARVQSKVFSEIRIEALKAAQPETLRRVWASCFRKRYPDNLPRALVAQLLAYRIQAKHHGDLLPKEVAYLAKVPTGKGPIPRFDDENKGHRPGTIFVREHGGCLHRVAKTVGGFEWGGKEFTSLSSVAFAITGTKWNGPRFFGIGADGTDRG